MTNQSSNARLFTRKLRQSSFCNEHQTFVHKLEMKRTSSTCESIINYVVITNCLLFLVFYILLLSFACVQLELDIENNYVDCNFCRKNYYNNKSRNIKDKLQVKLL